MVGKLKDISTKQLKEQVDGLVHLRKEYRKKARTNPNCILCIKAKNSCEECPWMWFTNGTCIGGILTEAKKQDIEKPDDASSAHFFTFKSDEWNKFRIKQIGNWLRRIRRELVSRKS